MNFLVWLRTDSNPADIDRFQSHTGKASFLPILFLSKLLTYQEPNEILQNWAVDYVYYIILRVF